MNRLLVKSALALAPFLCLLACGRHGAKVGDPLPLDQMRLVFQQSFRSADSATRDAANKIVEEAQQRQIAAAYADVKDLSAQANLTEEQRITAIRAANTIGEQLLAAAQTGDAQAAETLHSARSSH